MIKLFEDFVNEKTIGTICRKLSITVDIESTKHSEERQERHLKDGGRFITQDEITQLMSKAIGDITELLLFDKLDINNDKVILYDRNSTLNVVCSIEGESPKLKLVAVTVMLTDKFRKKDQLVLQY